MSFDQRVKRATQILDDDDWDAVEDVLHLVVDEVQDVVGVRADFLLALVRALPEEAGFTFLGDPAQAIYDFQIDPGRGSGTTCADLIAGAENAGAAVVVLRGQYRARGPDVVAILEHRSPDGRSLDAWGVEDHWNELPDIGDVETVARLVPQWEGVTVFLTRTNGEALKVAEALRRCGVPVDVRRPANRQAPAAWIAGVLADQKTNSLTRAEFALLLSQAAPEVRAADAWRALRSVTGDMGAELDLVALPGRLAQRSRIPIDLVAEPMGSVVVSTVHRAKGLEFDNVVCVEFDYHWDLGHDDEELARERFVAVTRARDRVVKFQWPGKVNLRLEDYRGGRDSRWVESGWKAWQTFGFEVRYGDVDVECPPGDEQRTVQEMLARSELTGQTVRLVRDPRRSTLAHPVYSAVHGLVTVARTTEAFGLALADRLRLGADRAGMWPDLSGVTVEGVVTAVGERQAGGVGGRGLWLVPVLSGMAKIEWSTSDE